MPHEEWPVICYPESSGFRDPINPNAVLKLHGRAILTVTHNREVARKFRWKNYANWTAGAVGIGGDQKGPDGRKDARGDSKSGGPFLRDRFVVEKTKKHAACTDEKRNEKEHVHAEKEHHGRDDSGESADCHQEFVIGSHVKARTEKRDPC